MAMWILRIRATIGLAILKIHIAFIASMGANTIANCVSMGMAKNAAPRTRLAYGSMSLTRSSIFIRMASAWALLWSNVR